MEIELHWHWGTRQRRSKALGWCGSSKEYESISWFLRWIVEEKRKAESTVVYILQEYPWTSSIKQPRNECRAPPATLFFLPLLPPISLPLPPSCSCSFTWSSPTLLCACGTWLRLIIFVANVYRVGWLPWLQDEGMSQETPLGVMTHPCLALEKSWWFAPSWADLFRECTHFYFSSGDILDFKTGNFPQVFLRFFRISFFLMF